MTVRANGSAIPGCINIRVNTATGTATWSSTWLTAGTHDLYTEYSGFRLFLASYARFYGSVPGLGKRISNIVAIPTPWPPVDRIVKAFGQAVGQPVWTIQLPYGP